MDTVEIMLKKIEPIIMNCRKKTKIPSWDLPDYLQEGRIIALELYHQISIDPPVTDFNFYVFFKVKFSCFLIDTYRGTRAYKRQYDQLNYLSLEQANQIFDQKQNVAEDVIYHLLYQEILEFLSPVERQLFLQLKSGQKIDRNKRARIKRKILDYINKYWRWGGFYKGYQ